MMRKTALAAILLGLAGAAVPDRPAVAQGRDWKILFGADPKDPNPKPGLRLRPNVAQPTFLFVRNDSADDKDLTVEVLAGGEPVPGAWQKVKVMGGETKRVSFGKPPDKPGDKAPAPIELKLPVQVRVLDGKNAELDKHEIQIGRPADFVEVTEIQYDPREQDGKRNRLKVTVRARPNFSGPPARVELIVRPDRIPGLDPASTKEGTYAGQVSRLDREPLTLAAENLRFRQNVDHGGPIYLAIDGYQRAFVFQTTFIRAGLPTTPERIDRPLFRLDAPASAAPGPQIRIGLEVDNASPGAVTEFGFDPSGSGQFQQTQYPGDRRQRMFLNPVAADGALNFQPMVEDWSHELNATGVFGKRAVRLRLLDQTGKPTTALDGRTGKPVSEIVQAMTLDASPPQGVQFVNVPQLAPLGQPLALQAVGRDPDSDIRQVVFFAGKPDKDGKPPATAVTADGKLTDAAKGIWSGSLPVAQTAPGLVEVSVQFTNGAGLAASATTAVSVGNKPDGTAAGPGGKASIEGTVTEGDRLQPGLTVFLGDQQGKELARTQTDDKGKYSFTGLAAGTYRVVVIKAASKTRGEAVVTLKDGEQRTGVALSLRRS